MRPGLLLVCLWGVMWLVTPYAPAQQKTCGTVVTPEQVALELERAAEGMVLAIPPPVSQPYYLPLSIHVVRQSDGSGGLTLRELAGALQN